jgi:hypothetical protein
MGSKFFVFCEKSEQRERGLRVAVQEIHAGSGAPEKQNAPIQIGAHFLTKKSIALSKNLSRKICKFPKDFFTLFFSNTWKDGKIETDDPG